MPKILNYFFASCSFKNLNFLMMVLFCLFVFNSFGFIFSVSVLHFKQYVNIFYNGSYLLYEKFRINFCPKFFLLVFCFKNLWYFSYLISIFWCLFVIITFFWTNIISMPFYTLKNKFSWFLNDDNIFLTMYFTNFDFIEWFDWKIC